MNKPKYHVGQKIVVRSPVTTESITKNRMYVAVIRATPEESKIYQPAFRSETAGISYGVFCASAHLQGADWIVVGNLTKFTKLLMTVNNFLNPWRSNV